MKLPSLLISSSSRARRAAGFTLVEIAVVVLIGSMLLVAGLSLFKARLDAAQVEVTQKRQDAIKQALIAYLARNKRLPCPDTDNNGAENRNGGPPFACTANFGNVPYVDIGLERSAALDGWENYIRYVVSPNWRFTYSSNVPNQWNSGEVPDANYDADAAFVPKVSTGVVAVYLNTLAGATPILDPCNGAAPSNNGPVVALVSHGKNGFYATNVSGISNVGPAGPNDETQNATPTLIPAGIGVPPCAWNILKVIKRDPSDTFDDVVMTIGESEFTAPLAASGAILSSLDAAISRATDFVNGSLVRSACGPCTGFQYTLQGDGSPGNGVTFPSEVLVFGVLYRRGLGLTAIDSMNPIAATSAYTLELANGTVLKTVTVGELRGMLLSRAGFI